MSGKLPFERLALVASFSEEFPQVGSSGFIRTYSIEELLPQSLSGSLKFEPAASPNISLVLSLRLGLIDAEEYGLGVLDAADGTCEAEIADLD